MTLEGRTNSSEAILSRGTRSGGDSKSLKPLEAQSTGITQPEQALDSDCVSSVDEHDVEQGSENIIESIEKERARKSCCFGGNKMAVRFGLRLSIVLTLSSLFVLVQNPDNDGAFPQGTWVYVSALMVSFFPSLDVASVAYKTFQRILGTILGAILGMCCGFLSSPIDVYAGQATFIGVCIAVVTFLVSFAMVQGVRLFSDYPYATLLCLLTFGITILPFYTESQDEWKVGVYRISNVIIGCGIAALGALVLWPRSSVVVLEEKGEQQVKLAGEASDALLQFASEILGSQSGRRSSSIGILTESKVGVEEGDDAAYQIYNKAICEYKAAVSVFPLSKYDPYNLCRDNESFESYRKQSALTLSRCLRIQTTIVLMDAALRNDSVGGNCTTKHRALFRDIGDLIKAMLSVPCDRATGDVAADKLLDRLDEVKDCLRDSIQLVASSASTRDDTLTQQDKEEMKEQLSSDLVEPLQAYGSDNFSILFLQLVEQLTIRSLRLYYTWRNERKSRPITFRETKESHTD